MAKYVLVIDAIVREVHVDRPPNYSAALMASSVEEVPAAVEDSIDVGWLKDSTFGYIPPAPGPFHTYDGSAWIYDPALEEAAKDAKATGSLGTPVNRVLRDVLWDLEQRLESLGASTAIPELAGAAGKAAYGAALKDLVKAKN